MTTNNEGMHDVLRFISANTMGVHWSQVRNFNLIDVRNALEFCNRRNGRWFINRHGNALLTSLNAS